MDRTRVAATAAVAFLMVAPACRRATETPGGAVPSGEAPAPAASSSGDGAATRVSPPILSSTAPDPTEWDMAVARVEEVRGGGAPVQVPAEMRHYAEKRFFLARQIADARQNNFDLPHDMAELAQMIKAGELVELPRLGESHILYEVGEDAREDPLAHWDPATNKEVPLVGSEAELQTALASASAARKTEIEQAYADPARRELLFREHQAVHDLARDFGGRSYDLQDPDQRAELQRRMLSFLRPAARDIVLDLARGYHAQFQRPLPVTSMIRTQRYQRRLSRVNANATKIDIPPHTTGMAFDISYKFMSPAEQTWVMDEVARLEREGRLEALREKRNHLHVYAFVKDAPPDTQVAQYLDDVRPDAPAKVSRATDRRVASSRTSRSKAKTRRAR
jgi:hypothetical protein